MNKLFPLLFFFAFAAYGQMQERIAIINTLDDRDSISTSDLTYLTDRLREVAVNVLPSQQFGVMTTESIVAFLGSMENTVKVCKESSCLAEIGRKVSADYVAQGRIGRFSDNLTIKVELYKVKTGNLMGSFTGNFKDIYGSLALIDEKAPDLFKKMLEEPKAPKPEPEVPSVKEPSKTSFYIAVGLDVLGVAFISTGILKNEKVKEEHDKYNKRGQSPEYYEDAGKKVKDEKNMRNVFYAIGGVFLASGIGVHIWF